METASLPAAMRATLLWLLMALGACDGSYVITTPRQWITGETNQVCVNVQNEAAPAGFVALALTTTVRETPKEERNETILPAITFQVPAGRVETCFEVTLPEADHFDGKLSVRGRAGGADFEDTRDIRLQKSRNLTFVQTDKYLYQPGQEVKFRVLTIRGWRATVATDPYPEIWVTTPSDTRIAQWIDAASTSGLLHLAFQLADEPEEGLYTIHVRGPGDGKKTRSFKVEEFVLPRFEVKVTPPQFALATDRVFTFNVCANYTFGQPLKGTVTLTVSNNQRRKCRINIKRTEPISGCKDISVTSKELRITDCHVFRLSATAVVEEDGTGVRLNHTASASVSRSAVNFVTVYEDNYKKPNLPFTLKVKATLPDDSPAVGVPVEVCAAGMCTNRTTQEDGVFTVVVASDDASRVFMSTLNCRADLSASTFSKDIRQYFSPSNSSLLLQVPEKKLKCEAGLSGNYNLPVWFSANNQPRASLTVQVVSRGKIQHLSTRQVSFAPSVFPIDTEHLVDTPTNPGFPIVMGVLNLPISLPPTASPTAQVLLWYTRDDGEVVSDAAEVQLERCLGISANLTFSERQALPGAETTVALTSEPDAICSVGIVDRSTELLNPDPTPVTLDAIFSYLDDYKIYPWVNPQVNDFKHCERRAFEEAVGASGGGAGAGDILFPPIPRFGYYTDYVDALTMFDAVGVHVISNLILETRPCEKEDGEGGFGGGFAGFSAEGDLFPNRIFAGGIAGAAPPSAAGGAGPAPEEAEGTAPRTLFPETWLWELVAVPASGVIQDRLKLPDTITEWVGQAVCAHAEKGVGLSERASITAFTPFFTDLTLPPSVKRGEVLPVTISVFNYLDQPLPVRVVLQGSPEYQVVDDPTTGGASNERASCLAPQDKAVHTIKVRTMALGDVNLTVSAAVDSSLAGECGGAAAAAVSRRDTLIKPIKVEAEGFPREETWTKYLCAEEVASGEDAPETWEVVPPANIVPDSARGWVTAVGDLLALSIENLGSLIRHPSGCGEQNMVNFAPNIYIMQYLTATNQATPENTQKLLRFMRTGYQRELLYRRNDSSYSAFGNADDSGSTWLTAFVLKSFAQARRFISVDTESLDRTRHWLSLSTRDPRGCIDPQGKIFSKGLTGGLAGRSSTVPLTAYVLTALLEAGVPINTPIVMDAGRCVLADSSNDPYTLALKAYALALAKDPNAQRVIQDLLSLAVVENNALYWKLPQGSSNALEVETAGYAILALMAQDPLANTLQARKIVKWITSKRNGQGGFYSTQDTVVALQAMASYETHTFQGPLNVVATVTATDLSHSFTLTEQNKLLQQLVTLPSLPTSVSVNMDGQGCAVMQAVLRYNVPEAEPSDAFSLRVRPINDPRGGCVEKRLEACAAYLLPDGKSNMAVIEVNLVSGFIPEKDDLKAAVSRNPEVVKRYEVDGSKVTFYIEEFTAQEVCVSFRVVREVEIEDVKPGSVVVYDYYQPEFSISKSYSFPFLDGCKR